MIKLNSYDGGRNNQATDVFPDGFTNLNEGNRRPMSLGGLLAEGKRYSEEQIIRILKEVESGKAMRDVCRKYGVSEQSVNRGRSQV
jgi:putative transposase